MARIFQRRFLEKILLLGILAWMLNDKDHDPGRNWQLPEWEKVSCQEEEDYKIFKILRCKFQLAEKGKVGNFFVIKCNDWVQVIAETREGKLVMVEQYRFGSEGFSLELPGGVMEEGESPIEAAQRELEEETGFCGDSAEIIATFRPNPAIQSNTLHLVLIKNCEKCKQTHFDEFEDLKTYIMTKPEIIDAIKTGKICHGIPIAALLEYFFL